jgi:dienelactone hydrolase
MPDALGNIDLSRQSPVSGTYSGISTMGLIQSMQLPNPDYGRVRFNYEWAKPLVTKLVAESDGKPIASTEFARTFVAPGVTTRAVHSDGLTATLFVPGGTGPFPALIVLGGSEGGNSAEDVGAVLSSHGYVCLALAYFALDPLPASLEEIPVEYFARALNWLANQKLVRRDKIGILGTSKGAEAALLLAARDRRIRAVVAYEPSAVVWSCLCESTGKSSWSWQGSPVAFVPFEEDPANRPPEGFPLRIGRNYEFSLNNKSAVQRAAIPVERINGPILLISGKDDQLWPSFRFGRGIMQRLAQRHHRFPDQHLAYPDAGHLIGKAYLPVGSTLIAGGQIETGGSLSGNAKAQEDSWPNVLRFLHRALPTD